MNNNNINLEKFTSIFDLNNEQVKIRESILVRF